MKKSPTQKRQRTQVLPIAARRAKKVLFLTRLLIGAEWGDRTMPTLDEWERIRILAA